MLMNEQRIISLSSSKKHFKINCFVSKLIYYGEENVLYLKEKRHKQVSVVEEWNQIMLQNDKVKYS